MKIIKDRESLEKFILENYPDVFIISKEIINFLNEEINEIDQLYSNNKNRAYVSSTF